MMACNVKQEIKYPDIKKCGDITTLLTIGKKEFFLNCEFCENTYIHLENFMQHMYDNHLTEFQPQKFEDDTYDEMENIDFSEKIDKMESDDDADYNFRGFERVEIELDSFTKNNEFTKSEELAHESSLCEDIYDVNSYGESNDSESSAKSTGIGTSKAVAAKQVPIELKKMFPTNKMRAIFSSYVGYPALWDEKVGIVKNKNERKRLFQSIALDVGMPNEWKNIQLLLRKLRVKLRTEITRKQIYESKGQLYTPTWYTNLPSFLKQRIQTPKRTNEEKAMRYIPPSTLITEEQIATLAELYKGFPCLWDENDIKYRFGNRREEALVVVQREFNVKSGLNLTRQDLESEITKLRKICSNEKRRKVACKKLNSHYKPTCPFYDHIEFLEVDVPPFECSICGALLSAINLYKVHLASHNGSLPYKCNLCDHEFRLVANLTVHLRRHVHDYVYTCEMCDKSFATSTDLKVHTRSHTGEKPYFCDICGKRYQTASLFSTHMQRHENRPLHRCEMCAKPFFTKAMLKEHMNVHLKIRDKICNICNKGFTSRKHLRQHKQIHAGKKYLCKICDKRFAQYAGLSGHMKSHGTTLAISQV